MTWARTAWVWEEAHERDAQREHVYEDHGQEERWWKGTPISQKSPLQLATRKSTIPLMTWVRRILPEIYFFMNSRGKPDIYCTEGSQSARYRYNIVEVLHNQLGGYRHNIVNIPIVPSPYCWNIANRWTQVQQIWRKYFEAGLACMHRIIRIFLTRKGKCLADLKKILWSTSSVYAPDKQNISN